mmetsp:Transcript_20140/g.45632  ORF Transcript_20140/g.45632 Transcript_20140/m.45632 type:complete len:115 (+) Transcript_20140:462-806(+)
MTTCLRMTIPQIKKILQEIKKEVMIKKKSRYHLHHRKKKMSNNNHDYSKRGSTGVAESKNSTDNKYKPGQNSKRPNKNKGKYSRKKNQNKNSVKDLLKTILTIDPSPKAFALPS